jgi:hypothetical protein
MSDYRDLFEKCTHDLNALPQGRVDLGGSYSLFNLILSLNHLPDWVLNDSSVPHQTKINCVRRFYPYAQGEKPSREFAALCKALSSTPQTNVEQRIIRLVANRIKHLEVGRAEVSQSDNVFMGGVKRDMSVLWVKVDEKYYDARGQCHLLHAQWKEFVIGEVPIG